MCLLQLKTVSPFSMYQRETKETGLLTNGYMILIIAASKVKYSRTEYLLCPVTLLNVI